MGIRGDTVKIKKDQRVREIGAFEEMNDALAAADALADAVQEYVIEHGYACDSLDGDVTCIEPAVAEDADWGHLCDAHKTKWSHDDLDAKVVRALTAYRAARGRRG